MVKPIALKAKPAANGAARKTANPTPTPITATQRVLCSESCSLSLAGGIFEMDRTRRGLLHDFQITTQAAGNTTINDETARP